MKLKNGMKCAILLLSLLLTSVVFAQDNREAHRAAMEACVQELGIQRPQPGQRPTEADMQKLRNCLSQKGISMPQKPPTEGRPPRGHWNSGQAPEAVR